MNVYRLTSKEFSKKSNTLHIELRDYAVTLDIGNVFYAVIYKYKINVYIYFLRARKDITFFFIILIYSICGHILANMQQF